VAGLLSLESNSTNIDDLAWVNHGYVVATGLELEGEWRFKRLEGLGSYTLQRTRDRDTGLRLSNSPTHAAKLRVSTPGLVAGATIAFETQYLGPRTTLTGQIAPSATTANLTIVQPIGTRLDLVGAARNIFDAHWGDPGSAEHLQDIIEQDGRTVSIGLRWRFRK
jgi:outer membrane receptor for ferrienterochelin and colicin